MEQGLIGLGNFLVSWTALRTLSVPGLASFAIAWSVAWAVFAVLSESLINPLRVRLAESRDSSRLDQTLAISGTVALPIVGLALATSWFAPVSWAGVALGVAGVPLTALVFYLSRSVDIAAGRLAPMIVRGGVYFVASAGLVALISAVGPSPSRLLAGASLSLLVAGAVRGLTFTPFHRVSSSVRMVAGVVWSARWFAAATLVRVVLYSTLLLVAMRAVRGPNAAAVIAASFTLIAPIQLLSSTLPWVFLPRLAERTRQKGPYLKEASLQAAVYLILTVVSAAMLALVWGPWTSVSVGSPAVLAQLNESMPFVLLTLSGVLLTSWSSSVLQSLRLQGIALVAALLGGCVAMLIVFTPADPVLAGAAPYLVALLTSLVGLGIHARTLRRTDD